jgi:membrane associated rhomboid family serine protease
VNDLLSQFAESLNQLVQNLHIALMMIAVLFAIHFVNWILGYRLNYLGIHPRREIGLPGIIFSPFLHGDFNHLFFNAIPLLALVSFVLLKGMPTFILVTTIIVLLGGAGTWLFGRRGIHIGASGLIMGYWSYLLVLAYQHTTPVSFALAIICVYYFGGLFLNLFPTKIKSSWESHVFGFLAGIAAAYICPILIQN